MNSAGADIACIVLAAGYGRRFGADKRGAATAAGGTLLDLTLDSIPPLFSARLLVLHPGDEALAARYRNRWQAVIADKAKLGMGYSLAAGLAQVGARDGIVIVLADMPRVLPATYAALVDALDRESLVVPFHQGQRGNPVGIGARFFPELASPDGDSGARHLIGRHPAAVVRLEVADPGILLDIDTPEALTQLEVDQDSRGAPRNPA